MDMVDKSEFAPGILKLAYAALCLDPTAIITNPFGESAPDLRQHEALWHLVDHNMRTNFALAQPMNLLAAHPDWFFLEHCRIFYKPKKGWHHVDMTVRIDWQVLLPPHQLDGRTPDEVLPSWIFDRSTFTVEVRANAMDLQNNDSSYDMINTENLLQEMIDYLDKEHLKDNRKVAPMIKSLPCGSIV